MTVARYWDSIQNLFAYLLEKQHLFLTMGVPIKLIIKYNAEKKKFLGLKNQTEETKWYEDINM